MKKILLLITIIALCSCKSNTCTFLEYKDMFQNEKYYKENNLDKYISYYLLNNKSINNIISEINVGIDKPFYTNINISDISKNYLTLVNKYNYLDSNYMPSDLEEITSIYNKGTNNKLRHEARINFENMCEDMKKINLYIYNASAYRTYENQEIIYDYYLKKLGQNKADKISARASFSEHQLGLSVDVNSINLDFQNTSEYLWLINNSYKYGFILRYPKDKENITGYSFEPWHYRYVGKDVAKYIYEEDITFDEYYAYYLS